MVEGRSQKTFAMGERKDLPKKADIVGNMHAFYIAYQIF